MEKICYQEEVILMKQIFPNWDINVIQSELAKFSYLGSSERLQTVIRTVSANNEISLSDIEWLEITSEAKKLLKIFPHVKEDDLVQEILKYYPSSDRLQFVTKSLIDINLLNKYSDIQVPSTSGTNNQHVDNDEAKNQSEQLSALNVSTDSSLENEHSTFMEYTFHSSSNKNSPESESSKKLDPLFFHPRLNQPEIDCNEDKPYLVIPLENRQLTNGTSSEKTVKSNFGPTELENRILDNNQLTNGTSRKETVKSNFGPTELVKRIVQMEANHIAGVKREYDDGDDLNIAPIKKIKSPEPPYCSSEDSVEIISEKPELIDLTSEVGLKNLPKYIEYLDKPSTFSDNTYNIPSTSSDNRYNEPSTSSDNRYNVLDNMLDEVLTIDANVQSETSDCSPAYQSNRQPMNQQLYFHIMEIFPDADTDYLKSYCYGKEKNPTIVNEIMDEIFSNPDYPKRAVQINEQVEPDPIDIDKQFENLKEVFPDIDPTYLMNKLEEIDNVEKLMEFTTNALETKDYVKIKDTLAKEKKFAQAKQYTTEFDVVNFLQVIPDPDTYFKDPKLKATQITTNRGTVLNFLKNQFNYIGINEIKRILYEKENIMDVVEALSSDKIPKLKCKRKTEYTLEVDNIPLLQVFAYIKYKDQIDAYITAKKEQEVIERANAKANGWLKTCGCCYNEEVLESESVSCENGCIFCKECLQRSVEIAFGEAKLEYECLSACGKIFSLQTIQNTINPKLFSKIAQKKQMEEVKAAGIEDLEFCPFCDFASIPANGNKIFKCFNPDCMKESCRECKEPSHIPLRCNEVERDDDVKKRIYVENKMTEALLRKCYKCGLKFIKADGCNKMTCSCGARMCYVCNQPVRDYKHFNGQGGDRTDLCPLYSDTNLLHQENVMKVASEAKAEVGNELKVDPTQNMYQYFDDVRRRNPVPNLPGLQFGHLQAPQHVHNLPRAPRVPNMPGAPLAPNMPEAPLAPDLPRAAFDLHNRPGTPHAPNMLFNELGDDMDEEMRALQEVLLRRVGNVMVGVNEQLQNAFRARRHRHRHGQRVRRNRN